VEAEKAETKTTESVNGKKSSKSRK